VTALAEMRGISIDPAACTGCGLCVEDLRGALMLGHPEFRFGDRVTGKALPIDWNGAGGRAGR
jgi:hypothetical protein